MDEVQLAKDIEKHYSLSEIEALCFALKIDHENIVGTNKAAKCQNLVKHLARRNKLPELLLELRSSRPDVEAIWNNNPSENGPHTLSTEPMLTQPKQTANYLSIIITILIIVALGITIWVITSQQQTEEDFIFQVRVQDELTTEPIPNTQVTLDIAGEDVPQVQITDSNGLAIFIIDTNLNDAVATLTISANGHKSKTQVVAVSAGQRPLIITLENEP